KRRGLLAEADPRRLIALVTDLLDRTVGQADGEDMGPGQLACAGAGEPGRRENGGADESSGAKHLHNGLQALGYHWGAADRLPREPWQSRRTIFRRSLADAVAHAPAARSRVR